MFIIICRIERRYITKLGLATLRNNPCCYLSPNYNLFMLLPQRALSNATICPYVCLSYTQNSKLCLFKTKAIRVRRRSRRTFSTDFKICRRRFDGVVICFFNSDFKLLFRRRVGIFSHFFSVLFLFFFQSSWGRYSSYYTPSCVVFIFSLKFMVIFLKWLYSWKCDCDKKITSTCIGLVAVCAPLILQFFYQKYATRISVCVTAAACK